ncbi:MAG: alkaline phosphatase [Paramuribaculum sp.]|nr:alkaline phosphatase [Paramuribaculum sp.]
MRLRISFSLILCCVISTFAGTPKYIFYCIGDGMGMSAVTLAQDYKRMVLGNDSLLQMMQFPVASAAFTHSSSSPVTDSAAAGTALATGYKTKNSMLGMDSDTMQVVSIAKQLHDIGYGVGLVTTVAPDDATPGAFYAHVPNRGMFYEIGKSAAESGYEFIAGANLRGTKDADGNLNDLLDLFERNRVSVVRGLDKLSDAEYSKILLLNTDTIHVNDVGYALDSVPGVLTLTGMTQACLQHLLNNKPEQFFMMIEGGSIDHGAHANDAATVVKETLNFDNAVKIAYDFYKQHPEETLIVVTADHETGGLALGNRRLGYNIKPELLQYQKLSKDRFYDELKSLARSRMVLDYDDMKSYISENIGLFSHIPVQETEEAKLKEAFDKMVALRNGDDTKALYWAAVEFVDYIYALVSQESGIGWTTGAHTGSVVPVYAVGVGADEFAALQDNTDIPKKIARIVGLK